MMFGGEEWASSAEDRSRTEVSKRRILVTNGWSAPMQTICGAIRLQAMLAEVPGTRFVCAVKLHYHLIAEIIRALETIFVERRQPDKVIERTFKAHTKWGGRDRKLVAESVYECVRWWRWYWYLAGLPDAGHADLQAMTPQAFWRVWGTWWWTVSGEVPPFIEMQGLTSEELKRRASQKVAPAIRASIPDWLDEVGERSFGERWAALRPALNKPADVFLRTNTLKTDRDTLIRELTIEDVPVEAVKGLPDALRLRERRNVFGTKAFRSGLFEVQDAASQHIAPFCQVAPGMRVIDACAGGGGKSLHLAAMMKNKGRIIAMDVHQWKLDELRRRAARDGVDVIETRVIEGTREIKRQAGAADCVLLDVPCSGLGVLRRNPDAKWKLSLEEIQRLTVLQGDILRSHCRMVKKGGTLVYATCSLLPAENEDQIKSFLAERGDEWRLDEERWWSPEREGWDGFYAARLVRSDAVVVAPME